MCALGVSGCGGGGSADAHAVATGAEPSGVRFEGAAELFAALYRLDQREDERAEDGVRRLLGAPRGLLVGDAEMLAQVACGIPYGDLYDARPEHLSCNEAMTHCVLAPSGSEPPFVHYLLDDTGGGRRLLTAAIRSYERPLDESALRAALPDTQRACRTFDGLAAGRIGEVWTWDPDPDDEESEETAYLGAWHCGAAASRLAAEVPEQLMGAGYVCEDDRCFLRESGNADPFMLVAHRDQGGVAVLIANVLSGDADSDAFRAFQARFETEACP